jgi:tRNA pseudouridine55 synthase
MEEHNQNQKTNTLLLVDKPAGISSFDVIRILRRKLSIKKMGHSGTLDPFATGLMLIGVEKGTKELHTLIKLDKTYIAEIVLGIQTDTGDITGKKLVEQNTQQIEDVDIETEFRKLVGSREYRVPKYSAIKVAGKKLYELARSGLEFEAPLKQMTVYNASIQSIRVEREKKVVTATFHVASGTYIRTLGEELGNLLSVPATLVTLRRLTIGDYRVEDAITLDPTDYYIK